MAGDWIAARMDLHEDPAVIGISDALGIDPDLVAYKCLRVWGLANRQSADGFVPFATGQILDRFLACPGFAAEMERVGWLNFRNGGVEIPNFCHWNGKSAKDRLTNSRRKAALRENERVPKMSRSKREKTVATEQNRTEEQQQQQQSAEIVAKLKARGLESAKAKRADAGLVAIALELWDLKKRDTVRPLKDAVAAFVSMLTEPGEWGLEIVDGEWHRPKENGPPTAQDETERIQRESAARSKKIADARASKNTGATK